MRKKSHYLKQFSHQPKEERIVITILLMRKLISWSCSAQNQELARPARSDHMLLTQALENLGFQVARAQHLPPQQLFTRGLSCYIKSTTLWTESHVDAPWVLERNGMELLVQSPQLKDKKLKVQRG